MGLFRSTAPDRRRGYRRFTVLPFTVLPFTVLLFTVLLFPTAASAATVLFVTDDNGSYTTAEQPRVAFITSWGHTILPIHERATQAEFDAAVDQADVAYFSAESTHVLFNPLNACIGAVVESDVLYDEFGFAQGSFSGSRTNMTVIGPIHYITAGFFSGSYPMFNPAERMHWLTGTVAPGLERLAYDTSTNNTTLAVLDVGAQLYPSGTAAARRVWLPWGTASMSFDSVTAEGRDILQRSLEWAAQVNSCTRLNKAAFLTDGTPIADGSNLPIGASVDFLLYVNNTGAARSDISVQDLLDPTFLYQPGSLRVNNSQPQCAAAPCSAAEEAAIFAAAKTGTIVTDAIDGDVASISGSTVNAGNAVAANAQLDIAANRIWALLFSVTIQ